VVKKLKGMGIIMQKEKYTIIIRVLLGLFACMLLTGDAFAEMSNRSFIALCWKGTLKQVNDAIEKGANVNGRHDQWSPLLVAAQSNPDPEVIRVLIKAGADIKAKSKDGSTPLYMAARYNTVSEVTTVLIEAGADVNARNKYDRTPLVSAASFNSNLEVITALIEAGRW